MADETECKHFNHGYCKLFKKTCDGACPYYLGLIYMAQEKIRMLGTEDAMGQEIPTEPTAAENAMETAVVNDRFGVATWDEGSETFVFQFWEDSLEAALQNARAHAAADNMEHTIFEITYIIRPVINAEVFKAISLLPKKK